MITNLRLENFGRFREKTFSFAPVTVFSGNNESGKTTLFDALFDAISSPKANTEYGKILVRRYGKERRVSSEYDGAPLSINEKDFMNLFAVRSGSINLEIEQNSQWMNQVKASLFSGGIDPLSIVEKLNDTLNSRAKGSLRGEEKILKTELETLETDKRQYEKTRQMCFDEENRMAGDKDRMYHVKEEILQQTKLFDELEKTISQQKMLQEEKDLNNKLANIAEWQRNKDEQEKNTRFNDTVFEDLKKRDEEIRRLASEAAAAAAQEEATRRELAASIEGKGRFEAEKARGDSKRVLAEHLLDTLKHRDKLVSTKVFRIWRKPFLAAAALLLVAGVLGFFLTDQNLIILAAALGAAVISVAIAPTRQKQEDRSALDNAVNSASEKWKKETGEDLSLNYEELLAALGRSAERSLAQAEDYEQAVTRSAALEKEAESHAIRKTQLNNNAEAAQRELRRVLEDAGATDLNNYAARLEAKKITVERGNELDEKLKLAMTAYNAASPLALKDIISGKIEDIKEKITETELSPQELRVKENLLIETKGKLEALRQKELENTGSLSLDQGTLRERLRGLPEKITGCEKDIREKKARLAEIERELRAAKIAQELFASVAEDSGLMLQKLSGEIAELFSTITETGRKVTMENFSMDNVNVDDTLGKCRDSDFLSTGTRDAFLLAARLTLARKSMESAAIIVLDEPFLALDRPRTGRALSILKEFHAATLWQLVLFTKDEETVSHAREVFGNELCVHELGS